MKRSVAIVGPTPEFLRWAISYSCPLREIYPARLPETTFRQLRGVRELSLAVAENRLQDGFCVHPSASADKPTEALGFPASEIVDLFGGLDTVREACTNCPANAVGDSRPGMLAGCYGWLPVDPRFDFEAITRGFRSIPAVEDEHTVAPTDDGLIEYVQRAVATLQLAAEVKSKFLSTQPVWYGLWSEPVLSAVQLDVIEPIFRQVLAELKSEIVTRNSAIADDLQWKMGFRTLDLIRFIEAASVCRTHGLPLHVDLVPGGYSDGQRWTIAAHCGTCKSRTTSASPQCHSCGKRGDRQNEIKLKVLGLRPYMHLHAIFGEHATKEFLLRNERRMLNSGNRSPSG